MRGFLLTVLLGCLLLPATAHSASRVALVIGNASYERIQPLRNPANDASLMAATLERLGFDVVVTVDSDRRGMSQAIREFGKRLAVAGTDSVGLFFYAGHGVQSRGTNYLLPIRSEVLDDLDLQIEAIDTNWVLAQMEQAGNALNIVILDACRNNPYGGSVRGSERGLARIDAPSGSLVAYSAAPGQAAFDGEGANSPYTSALAEAMQRPGNEIVRVFRQTRVAVEAQTGGAQTPWEEQSLRGDFYFRPGETEVAAISPQPADQSTTLDTDLETAFWNTVKDSDYPKELQAYIDAYPNGTFTALAQLLIARLEATLEEEDEAGLVAPGEGDPSLEDRPDKGYLGVRTQPLTDVLAGQLGLQRSRGVFVTSVIAGSPAEQAGIQIGDVIAEFDGREITAEQPFHTLTDRTSPGQVVDVRITRNGARQSFRATLVDRNEARRLVEAAKEAARERQANLGDAATHTRYDGDPQAAEWFLIAERYYYGRGARQSYEEALNWYRRAAEYDHPDAIYSVGWMHAAGEGVDRDFAEAARWHRRAADIGHAGARAELGYLYDTGRGVPRDPAEAVRLYRLAADAGHARAMGNLAVMLDAGRGAAPDPATAAQLLLRSFATGDQITQSWLFSNPGNWTSATRRELQRLLREAGHYDGAIDGDIGPGTRRALDSYRSSQSG